MRLDKLEKIKKFKAKTVNLPNEDIDTDQIIPARFLTLPSKEGIGECLFADWRIDNSGNINHDFILNKDESKGCEILVAGNNFGCGSSREHAPWALVDYGFKAVISSSFADIFKNNSLKNGLLPIVLSRSTHNWLLDNPGVNITIDLENTRVEFNNGDEHEFEIEAFSKYCLINGLDELSFILNHEDDITKYEGTL